MKKLLLLILFPFAVHAQSTDANIKTNNHNLIRDARTIIGVNEAAVVDQLIDSKVSILAPRLLTTSIPNYVWTASDNLGNGSWAQTLNLTSLSAQSPLSYNSSTGMFSLPSWPSNSSGVLTNNGSGVLTWSAPISTFQSLTDGPGVFTSHALNYARVNSGATALEYRSTSQMLSDISGVPTSRLLTINGTALDLSADRTWTISTATNLASLTDANITTPTNGQFLQYQTSDSKWHNYTLVAGDIPTLNQNTTGTATNLSGTPALPNGTTATTQSANDNSTKLATTAYADAISLVANARLKYTAVKTSNYTATVFDAIPTDCSAGSFTVTLPTAPADGSVVVVKRDFNTGSNTVTVACGGSDVFSKIGSTSGATTAVLSLPNHGFILTYKSTGAIWYVTFTDDSGSLDASVTLKEEILSYIPVTSFSTISAASTFSGWGYPIGQVQKIRSVEFYIYAFDNALLPSLVTVRIRSIDSNGAVLFEQQNISISPALNTLTKYTVTLPSQLDNVSNSRLWFEYLTNGHVAIEATASGLPFPDASLGGDYPKSRYATNANSTGVTQANNSSSINGYIKVNYFNKNYTVPTTDFTNQTRIALDSTQIVHPSNVYTLATQESNLYFNQIVCTTLPRSILEYTQSGASTFGTLWEKWWRNDKTKTSSYAGTFNVFRNNVLQATKDITINVATVGSGSGTTRKALFIGDSNTASNIYPQTVYDDLQTFNGGVGLKITLVGTKGTPPYVHEGISGKTLHFFNTDPTSPFVFSGSFNFSQYLSTNSITMSSSDWVCFFLGTNDLFSVTDYTAVPSTINAMRADLDAMIANIQSAVPGIRICIMMSMPSAPSQDPWAVIGTATTAQTQKQFMRNMYAWWKSLIRYYDTSAKNAAGIYLLGTHACIDVENNFTKSSVAPNARISNSFDHDQVTPNTQTFTGSATLTVTITNTNNIHISSVYKNGLRLIPTTDYSFSDVNKTVTLVSRLSGDNIVVNYLSGYSYTYDNNVHPAPAGLNQEADLLKAFFKFYH